MKVLCLFDIIQQKNNRVWSLIIEIFHAQWIDGQTSGKLADTQRRLKSQIWSSVLTVLLIESKGLSPGEDKVIMDVFVKFRYVFLAQKEFINFQAYGVILCTPD